ncbi:MAG: hypothetical protein M1453_11560 [Acidobacteria bacterium]|nr:hypothetical protein [Acidobacteriota bacterium]MCL5288614.1 hypothetical protein [Acidobacteriota bacterium]
MRGKHRNDHPLQARSADLASAVTPSAPPPPANILEFSGVIPPDEAARMIREIEEAFERAE